MLTSFLILIFNEVTHPAFTKTFEKALEHRTILGKIEDCSLTTLESWDVCLSPSLILKENANNVTPKVTISMFIYEF